MQVGTSHLRLITVAMDLGATGTPQECRLVFKIQTKTGEFTNWKNKNKKRLKKKMYILLTICGHNFS